MLEWTIEYLPAENILLLTTQGQMEAASANAMVQALVEAARQHACTRHLVDHRATQFMLTLADYFERPDTNEQLGITRQFKTAMIFAQMTDDTKFMENVFRNRGFNLRHFTDLDQARAWLLKT